MGNKSKKQRRKFRIESAETLKAWDASGVQLTAAVQLSCIVLKSHKGWKIKNIQCFFCVTYWHCNNYKVCRYLKRHF